MTFITPLWLLGLLPWTAIATWLLRGQRDKVGVPFLFLWKARETAPPLIHKRAIDWPPLGLFFAIIAMLLAILGAARPKINAVPYTEGPLITIIVDRGLSMTARGRSQSRWKETAQMLRQALQARFGLGQTRLVLLPEDQAIDADRLSWITYAGLTDPPVADTRPLLNPTIQRELSRGDQTIFVISDQTPQVFDSRMIYVPPLSSVSNIGIVSAGATPVPKPEVMVRLRNDSEKKSVQILVGNMPTTWLDLPPRGEEKNYFLNVDRLDDSIKIEISPDDDQPLDNHAKLIRKDRWPTIEPRGDLPADLRRMLQSYSKVRHSDSQRSSNVIVSSDLIDEKSAGIVLARGNESIQSNLIKATDHPVVANLDLSKSLTGAAAASVPFNSGWMPIVSAGEKVILAVRENPARQVWIGFYSPDFARTNDFVILWTNALDWTAQGGDRFAFEGTSTVPMTNWPNIAWKDKVRNISRNRRGGADIAPILLLCAVGLLLFAAAVWK